MNAKINELNKKIGALMKAGEKEKVPPVKEDKKKLEAEKVELERLAVDAESRLETELAKIGNIVHESCIVSNDEENNAVQDCYWPNSRSEQADRDRRDKLLSPDFAAGVPGLLSHHEVLAKIKGYDQDRGVKVFFCGLLTLLPKVAGHRGYFLTGPGVDLNLAIIRYALDFLEKRDFSKLWTPFFMKKVSLFKLFDLFSSLFTLYLIFYSLFSILSLTLISLCLSLSHLIYSFPSLSFNSSRPSLSLNSSHPSSRKRHAL